MNDKRKIWRCVHWAFFDAHSESGRSWKPKTSIPTGDTSLSSPAASAYHPETWSNDWCKSCYVLGEVFWTCKDNIDSIAIQSQGRDSDFMTLGATHRLQSPTSIFRQMAPALATARSLDSGALRKARMNWAILTLDEELGPALPSCNSQKTHCGRLRAIREPCTHLLASVRSWRRRDLMKFARNIKRLWL